MNKMLFQILVMMGCMAEFVEGVAEGLDAASVNTTKIEYVAFLDERCSVQDSCYQLTLKDVNKIGHIVRMNIPSLGISLDQDLSLKNPENSKEDVKVIGIIERIFNFGKGTNENYEINFRLSPENRALFMEGVTAKEFDGRFELEIVVYNYDIHREKYFKRFHSDGKLLKFKVPEDTRFYSPEIDTRYDKPYLYSIELIVLPEPGGEIKYAFRSNKEFSRILD